MEEAKLSKTSSGKDATATPDASSLYQQCQDQLTRLNQQLAHHIACQRSAKLNSIIPSITDLSQQIQKIQNSINQEITLEESTNQKQRLLQKKDALIKNIQAHSKNIEKYKKQMVLLNINHEELLREFEDNRKIIEEKEMSCSRIMPKNTKESQRKLKIEKKQSLPSAYSPRHQKPPTNSIRLDTNSSLIEEDDKESKWSKIDRIFDRLSNLQFSNLSKTLVDLAKRQNGTIKGVFRNFKTNDKISEFAKSPEVRQELSLLLKGKRK